LIQASLGAGILGHYADMLLRTGELTLAQIANRSGYASPNAFAVAFRRHHGQPPGQWQRGELRATILRVAPFWLPAISTKAPTSL
jgi:AraC-like DNA-binding protein